ncbi:DUF922 domain-containing Zn-dependent protease [Agrobacterium sp. O3.4]|jgi:predicted secreted Zn-dependent protease|uniref:DUF922 domain-containing protein n=2 Tax=Rhizobium/Agrobacterium group TaxID=227290 RepID=A0A546XPW1_RHIRH|nr:MULTISPECIES: DUF922 domain-containing Zn-dependent protease [Rhizobium/Agrobacterium group]MCZ7463706.1 DUF922 domain-containing Zn-dependent protease [Rhizobium rhizogenes]MCZ7467608.1 DUF922 domain-containing Zn-dependent protease [Rhizobium rhizogenes]MCZ7485439.1 DUF922 domain-containing Zn-dependent protease [Rhizobium rhizogenes]MDA5632721.1 DUF922 domain-containing Zn-dependent protease [Agrobacterium sp. ST15.16.024]MDF1888588.1 DUF922 domain-containing Zn-dependent protease [Rhizo
MTKSSRALCVALAGALALSSAGPAFSDTIVRKTYSYFSITGKTAADLDQQLSKHGPLTRNTGARHPGATEIKFGGELTYVEKNGQCSVGTAKVLLNTRILLPRWKNRRRTTAELAFIWDTLLADIKRHEERHAEIARTHARSLERQLAALHPQKNCETLQEMVGKITQTVMDEHDRDQLRFDVVESKNFDARMTRLLKNRLEQGQNRR